MKGGEELDQLDELERRFIAAWNSPAAWRRAQRATLRQNLSRRTRLRLWYTSRIDHIAYGLICRRRFRAARALWRVTGHWRSPSGTRAASEQASDDVAEDC